MGCWNGMVCWGMSWGIMVGGDMIWCWTGMVWSEYDRGIDGVAERRFEGAGAEDLRGGDQALGALFCELSRLRLGLSILADGGEGVKLGVEAFE
jgi:hypothetical protein